MAMAMAKSNGDGFTERYSTIIQTITVVSMFVAAFWAGVILPINKELEEINKNGIFRSEETEIKENINRRFDADQVRLYKLEDGQVTRNELSEHWSTTEKEIAALHIELSDIQKELNTYGIGEAIKALQKQLDDLRLQVHGVPSVSTPVIQNR
jgi:hypothetical protein